jgi:hypothetical protein
MTAAPMGAAVMTPIVPRSELFVVLALPAIDVIALAATAVAIAVAVVVPVIPAVGSAAQEISDHLRFLSLLVDTRQLLPDASTLPLLACCSIRRCDEWSGGIDEGSR